MELLSTFWVDGGDAFDFVAPEFHPHGVVGIGQMDVHCVAFDPEVAAFELRNRPAVKACHQAVQQIVSCDALPHFKADHILVEFHGISNAVDATDARDHNHITSATQQGRGRGKSQLLNLIVDLEILLDVGVGGGNEGLRLVVIVVADEILHQVFREKRLEFAVELSGKGLVVAQDQGGTLRFCNDIGHGEGLARPCHPQQYLMRVAVVHAFDKLSNGLGLVAGGGERTVKLERAHGAKVGGTPRHPVQSRHKDRGMKKPRTWRGFSNAGRGGPYSATTSNLTVTTTSL